MLARLPRCCDCFLCCLVGRGVELDGFHSRAAWPRGRRADTLAARLRKGDCRMLPPIARVAAGGSYVCFGDVTEWWSEEMGRPRPMGMAKEVGEMRFEGWRAC